MNRNRTLVVFLLVVCVFCSAQVPRQKQSSPLNPTTPPKTEEGMIPYLLPDEIAHPERLKDVPRELAVAALTKSQLQASAAKADAIAYLLVILGYEVEVNHQRLAESLRSCTRDPETCDDRLVSYMSDLFGRGDRVVVGSLLDASKTTDSTLTELLGSSYQDMLIRDSQTLIAEIARRSSKDQRRLCHMIAVGDGGGIADESLAEVTAKLEELARGASPTAATAMMCLSEIRAFVPR